MLDPWLWSMGLAPPPSFSPSLPTSSLPPSAEDCGRAFCPRAFVHLGVDPPSYTHSESLAVQREHFGRSPSHLVLELRQAAQDRYVRILRRDKGLLRRLAEDMEARVSLHSSCRRSQFRQPLGRPSHFTLYDQWMISDRPERRKGGIEAFIDLPCGLCTHGIPSRANRELQKPSV